MTDTQEHSVPDWNECGEVWEYASQRGDAHVCTREKSHFQEHLCDCGESYDQA